MHCTLKISQISSSQQTEDFCIAPLPKLQYEQPHYSYLMTTLIQRASSHIWTSATNTKCIDANLSSFNSCAFS